MTKARAPIGERRASWIQVRRCASSSSAPASEAASSATRNSSRETCKETCRVPSAAPPSGRTTRQRTRSPSRLTVRIRPSSSVSRTCWSCPSGVVLVVTTLWDPRGPSRRIASAPTSGSPTMRQPLDALRAWTRPVSSSAAHGPPSASSKTRCPKKGVALGSSTTGSLSRARPDGRSSCRVRPRPSRSTRGRSPPTRPTNPFSSIVDTGPCGAMDTRSPSTLVAISARSGPWRARAADRRSAPAPRTSSGRGNSSQRPPARSS